MVKKGGAHLSKIVGGQRKVKCVAGEVAGIPR